MKVAQIVPFSASTNDLDDELELASEEIQFERVGVAAVSADVADQGVQEEGADNQQAEILDFVAYQKRRRQKEHLLSEYNGFERIRARQIYAYLKIDEAEDRIRCRANDLATKA